MKTKFLIIAASFLILISCADPGGDPIYEGFELHFSNHTDEEYLNTKVYIGGLKNTVFIATDSVSISIIKKSGNGYVFFGTNRWKPDLDKIRSISSERCFFMLKLPNNRKELIERYQQSTLFSLLLPQEANFKGDYGSLLIAVRENEITARALAEID